MLSFEQETVTPPDSKHKRLSLNRKGKDPVETKAELQFAVLSKQEIDESKKCIISSNTQKCTEWAVRLFNSWRLQRNESGTLDMYNIHIQSVVFELCIKCVQNGARERDCDAC